MRCCVISSREELQLLITGRHRENTNTLPLSVRSTVLCAVLCFFLGNNLGGNPWEHDIGVTNYGPLTVPNCFFMAYSGGLPQLLWHSATGSEGGLLKYSLERLRARGTEEGTTGNPGTTKASPSNKTSNQLGKWSHFPEVPAPSGDSQKLVSLSSLWAPNLCQSLLGSSNLVYNKAGDVSQCQCTNLIVMGPWVQPPSPLTLPKGNCLPRKP